MQTLLDNYHANVEKARQQLRENQLSNEVNAEKNLAPFELAVER
jgi:hypothetical protein